LRNTAGVELASKIGKQVGKPKNIQTE